jgi:hypothetical protein
MKTDFQQRSNEVGSKYETHVGEVLANGYGLEITSRNTRHSSNIQMDICARNPQSGEIIAIECKGADGSGKQSSNRSDNLWKVFGQIAVLDQYYALHPSEKRIGFWLATSSPPKNSARVPWEDLVAGFVYSGKLNVVVIPYFDSAAA